jgi:hypothetical protein
MKRRLVRRFFFLNYWLVRLVGGRSSSLLKTAELGRAARAVLWRQELQWVRSHTVWNDLLHTIRPTESVVSFEG